ncbi:hypothetical protein [Chitinophaga nivalis]|uniref:DUF3592 domain-containing protein n=1 Tax=Chitinophaga nivalis TaxID=2991709 RepID=A0ABT3ILQ1_9BACT|nr:hypothetical protein [Chitinophaga nivalis]MCW3465473.1 hypothetical protein [Chitinophaga nivalis]MCW3484836.1 hypothetical protein [Chitinophaga nivalis]
MIIYGRRSFCMKSFQLADIGIANDIPDFVKFEVRQTYVHIYWIPLFPIGKIWCVRKTDDKLYEVNAEILPALQSLPHPKVSWVAFIGLILIGVLFLAFVVAGRL